MPKSVHIFAWSLATFGAALLLYFIPDLPLGLLPEVLALAALAGLFEWLRMVLPNRTSFSLGSIFVFLAYATYGMPGATVVELGAAVASGIKSKRAVQRAFNMGQLLISLFGLHLTVMLLAPDAAAVTIRRGLAVLVGSGVFYLLNTTLLSVLFTLLLKKPLRHVFRDVLEEAYVGMLGGIVVFPMMTYTFWRGGWPTLLLNCGGLLGFRYAVNLYLEQKRIHLDSLSQLSRLLGRKQGANETHASRVAQIAVAVAEQLKLPGHEIDTIHAAAILHDIGEAEIDPRVVSVFARRAIPTLADIAAYQEHPTKGAELVGGMVGMAQVGELIRHHHEAWDGSGYPKGLKGEEIPLGARIIGAAEAIEELDGDDAARLSAIPKLAGTRIDPALVGPLTAAVRKAAKPQAKASAVMESESVASIQNHLLQAALTSKVLNTMGVAQVMSYQEGRFTNFIGDEVQPPAPDEVTRLAQKALRSQLPVRQQIIQTETAYDVYCIPSGKAVSVLLFNVTEVLEVEREQTRRIFRAYRDVIQAATKGRLTMIDEAECAVLLTEGVLEGEGTLQNPKDGAWVRSLVSQIAREAGMERKSVFRLTVSVSEAATNVFKHAGIGTVSVRRVEDASLLRVIIQDGGDGIPFDILPKAILTEGYSTKRSLGKGFSIMLRFVDRIYLHTSNKGTVIILEQHLPSEAEAAVTV